MCYIKKLAEEASKKYPDLSEQIRDLTDQYDHDRVELKDGADNVLRMLGDKRVTYKLGRRTQDEFVARKRRAFSKAFDELDDKYEQLFDELFESFGITPRFTTREEYEAQLDQPLKLNF